VYLMAEVRRVLGPVGEAPQAAFLELTPGVLDSVNRARNWLLEAGKQIGPEATAVSLNASVTWAYIEGFDPRDYDISGYCYVTEKPDPYWVRRPDPFIISEAHDWKYVSIPPSGIFVMSDNTMVIVQPAISIQSWKVMLTSPIPLPTLFTTMAPLKIDWASIIAPARKIRISS